MSHLSCEGSAVRVHCWGFFPGRSELCLLSQPEFSWLIYHLPLGQPNTSPSQSQRVRPLQQPHPSSGQEVRGDGPVPSGKGFLATKMSLTGAHSSSSSTECGRNTGTLFKCLNALNQCAEDAGAQTWRAPDLEDAYETLTYPTWTYPVPGFSCVR